MPSGSFDHIAIELEVAYHEAGHAIMGYVARQPIQYASIREGDFHVHHSATSGPPDDMKCWPVGAWGGYFGQVKLEIPFFKGINWKAYDASGLDFLGGVAICEHVFAHAFPVPGNPKGIDNRLRPSILGYWGRMGAVT